MEMKEKKEEQWIWNEGWPQPGWEEKGKEEGGDGKGGQEWPAAGCGEQGWWDSGGFEMAGGRRRRSSRRAAAAQCEGIWESCGGIGMEESE